MSDDDYPAFDPPAGVRRIDSKGWTHEEARAYFDWLREIAPRRAERFLQAIGVAWEEPLRNLAERVSERWVSTLADPKFRMHVTEVVSVYLPPPGIVLVLSLLGCRVAVRSPFAKVRRTSSLEGSG
jgi:hypothetical protein